MRVNLGFEFFKRYIDISMTRYIQNNPFKLQHSSPKNPEDVLVKSYLKQYGAKLNLAKEEYSMPALSEAAIKHLQK